MAKRRAKGHAASLGLTKGLQCLLLPLHFSPLAPFLACNEEPTVASVTKVFMTRVRLKTRNAGRKRKNALENHGTTPTRAAFFGEEEATAESSETSTAASRSSK